MSTLKPARSIGVFESNELIEKAVESNNSRQATKKKVGCHIGDKEMQRKRCRLERDSKPTVLLQWVRLHSRERFDPWRRRYREAILTAIDKAIVVRLKSLVSIAFLSEVDGGDTL